MQRLVNGEIYISKNTKHNREGNTKIIDNTKTSTKLNAILRIKTQMHNLIFNANTFKCEGNVTTPTFG